MTLAHYVGTANRRRGGLHHSEWPSVWTDLLTPEEQAAVSMLLRGLFR